MSRQLQPCGTVGAYHRHIRAEQPACDACRDAWSEYQAAWRAEPHAPRQPAPHGTTAGYRRHRYYGERVCGPCGLAQSDYDHDRYVARRGAAQ